MTTEVEGLELIEAFVSHLESRPGSLAFGSGKTLRPAVLRALLDAHAAQAERAGELEGLLEEASNAMRMTALAMEAPLGRPTKKHVQHWTSLFHAESQRIRAALLPATQAEGE